MSRNKTYDVVSELATHWHIEYRMQVDGSGKVAVANGIHRPRNLRPPHTRKVRQSTGKKSSPQKPIKQRENAPNRP